jgi:hypothetical protein
MAKQGRGSLQSISQLVLPIRGAVHSTSMPMLRKHAAFWFVDETSAVEFALQDVIGRSISLSQAIWPPTLRASSIYCLLRSPRLEIELTAIGRPENRIKRALSHLEELTTTSSLGLNLGLVSLAVLTAATGVAILVNAS